MPDSTSEPRKKHWFSTFALSMTIAIVVLSLMGMSMMPGNVTKVRATSSSPLFADTGISQVWFLAADQSVIGEFRTDIGFHATGASSGWPTNTDESYLNYDGSTPQYTISIAQNTKIYYAIVALNISNVVNAYLPNGWTFDQGLVHSFMHCTVNITDPASNTTQLIDYWPTTLNNTYQEWTYSTYSCYLCGIECSGTNVPLFEMDFFLTGLHPWFNPIGVMPTAPHYYTLGMIGTYQVTATLSMLVI
jgi:hypothetical protein